MIKNRLPAGPLTLGLLVPALLVLVGLASVMRAEEPTAVPLAPGPPQAIAEAVKQSARYAEMLAQWRAASSPDPNNMEILLENGQQAAAAILDAAEFMDDATFAEVVKNMDGYLISRDELIVAAPDSKRLIELAKEHGTPADVRFYELMGQTLNGYWPVTMEQLADLTGCIRYGSQDLVRLYDAWHDFKKQYPTAYTKAIHDPNLLLLADIEDQLLNGVASCDGPDAVAKEYAAFIKTHPNTELAAKLKKRMEAVQNGKSDMVFYQGVRYNHAE